MVQSDVRTFRSEKPFMRCALPQGADSLKVGRKSKTGQRMDGNDPIHRAPLFPRDDGLYLRLHIKLMRLRKKKGEPIARLQPGWSASLLGTALAPFLLLEFEGPGGALITWFLDETGLHLGDRVDRLPAALLGEMSRAIVRSRETREEAAAGLRLFNANTQEPSRRCSAPAASLTRC